MDAVWLCKIAERQMIRPSFVPPEAIRRRLRSLTRYRVDLVEDRSEKNRVEKLLEDAGIKLSVVACDLFGVSTRAFMQALIDGQRDPLVLAEMARTPLRAKDPAVARGVNRTIHRPPRVLLAEMLGHVDDLDSRIAAVEVQLGQEQAPFAGVVTRLDEIPGLGPAAAAMILAEIGTDMTRFPTPGHLASWAKFSPTVKESAGKPIGKPSTGPGNRYLAPALGEAGVAARTPTPSSANATDGWLADVARRGPWSSSDAPCSGSSGNSSATPNPHSLSSDRTTTTTTAAPTAPYDDTSTHGYDVILTPAA